MGFAIPSRKIVDFGAHFGGQNGRKIDENRGPKTHRKSIAFRKRFLSILGRFWDPRPPQKSSKIGQKSPKIGPVGHLVQKPELRRPQGANLTVFGSIREQFWTISVIFERFWDIWETILASYLHRPMLRGTHHPTASEKPNFEEHTLMIRATRSRSIDR